MNPSLASPSCRSSRRTCGIAATCVLFLLATTSSAQGVNFVAGVYNEGNGQYEFGLFDVGRTVAQFRVNDPPVEGATGCMVSGSAYVDRVGQEFRVSATYLDAGVGPSCVTFMNVRLGELPAGSYSLLATLVRTDGSGVQQVRSSFEVRARETVCGLTPSTPLLELGYAGADPSEFIARFNADPALRHSLADITLRSWERRGAFSVISADYPPLADNQRVLSTLRGSGVFAYVANLPVSGGCLGPCTPDITRLAVEYFHAGFDRYFVSDEPTEIAKLDQPATSGGWARTGETWQVVTLPQSKQPVPGTVGVVYRFWSANVQGVPSHFFTVDRKECAELRDGNKVGWTFEGAPFVAYIPKAEVCSVGFPLYRLYNNARNGAPSHRFATRLSVVEAMQAQGWTKEGVAMCVASE